MGFILKAWTTSRTATPVKCIFALNSVSLFLSTLRQELRTRAVYLMSSGDERLRTHFEPLHVATKISTALKCLPRLHNNL